MSSMKKLQKHVRKWTEKEKEQLLAALEAHGAQNIPLLASKLPTKSEHEVRLAIGCYENAASESLTHNYRKARDRPAPLDQWLEFLKNLTKNQQAGKDVASAIKYISLFEKQVQTNDVNLGDCYEFLGDVMTGKAPKKLDDGTLYFLMTSFAKVGYMLKKENHTKEKDFIDTISASKLQKGFVAKDDSVINDPDLNVLQIPSHLLEMDKNV